MSHAKSTIRHCCKVIPNSGRGNSLNEHCQRERCEATVDIKLHIRSGCPEARPRDLSIVKTDKGCAKCLCHIRNSSAAEQNNANNCSSAPSTPSENKTSEFKAVSNPDLEKKAGHLMKLRELIEEYEKQIEIVKQESEKNRIEIGQLQSELGQLTAQRETFYKEIEEFEGFECLEPKTVFQRITKKLKLNKKELNQLESVLKKEMQSKNDQAINFERDACTRGNSILKVSENIKTKQRELLEIRNSIAEMKKNIKMEENALNKNASRCEEKVLFAAYGLEYQKLVNIINDAYENIQSFDRLLQKEDEEHRKQVIQNNIHGWFLYCKQNIALVSVLLEMYKKKIESIDVIPFAELCEFEVPKIPLKAKKVTELVLPKKIKVPPPLPSPIAPPKPLPKQPEPRRFPLVAKCHSESVIPKEYVRTTNRSWTPKSLIPSPSPPDFTKVPEVNSYFRVFYTPHVGPSLAKTYQFMAQNNMLKLPF
uniref:Uncharacterized protein n=1 Tax=Panagrolaimus sp. JU765 TaxID=591449 RepID=A0AC34QW06_9BILA